MNGIIDLQIATEQDHIPTLAQFEQWVNAALPDTLSPVELTIRLVDTAEGTYLNETYRQKIGPTNILSFPFENEGDELPIPLLGDLVICVPVMLAEAKELGKSVEFHWAHLVVHGILHLLGYDHMQEQEAMLMEGLEYSILQRLGYPNPYGDR